MKYYTAGEEPNEMVFSRLTDLRAYLKDHPEIKEVHLWWYYRNDLVECRAISREDILARRGTRKSKGCTAQWAASRGRL